MLMNNCLILTFRQMMIKIYSDGDQKNLPGFKDYNYYDNPTNCGALPAYRSRGVVKFIEV